MGTPEQQELFQLSFIAWKDCERQYFEKCLELMDSHAEFKELEPIIERMKFLKDSFIEAAKPFVHFGYRLPS